MCNNHEDMCNNHEDTVHDWKFSCCLCCKNKPNDFNIMRRASVFRSFYYLSDDKAMEMAKSSYMTEFQVSLLNIELFSRGCAGMKFSL